MKTCLLFLLFVISISVHGQLSKLIPAKPSAIKLINDYTSTLSVDEENLLEQKLMNFRRATTNEITVVVLPTINGFDIADVALEISRKWGIGLKKINNGALLLVAKEYGIAGGVVVKKINNGALLLVAKNDRKLRIQTGYGLEATLTDLQCSIIINNAIKPAFKSGKFYEGIDAGTNEMIAAINKPYGDSLQKGSIHGDDDQIATVDTTMQQSAATTTDVVKEKSDNEQGNFASLFSWIGSIFSWIFNIFSWIDNIFRWISTFIIFSLIVFIIKKIFGIKSRDNYTSYSDNSSSDSSSSSYSSSSNSSSSSDSSSSSSSDFGGGDSGGGGSSDSW